MVIISITPNTNTVIWRCPLSEDMGFHRGEVKSTGKLLSVWALKIASCFSFTYNSVNN